jgi:hypothetical protein
MKKIACIACGAHPPSDAHHIKSRGSGGDDRAENLIPLCRKHHTLWHQLGPGLFLDKFPHVLVHLKKLGWEFEGGKLFHKSFTKLG